MSDPIELTVVNATPVTVAVVDGDTISVSVNESQPVTVSIEQPSAQIVEVTVGQPASISVSIGTPETIELELPPEQVIFVDVPESGESAAQWTQNAMQWKEPPVFLQTIAAGKVYQYTYNAGLKYRLVPSPYNASEDAFYATLSGGSLSGKICQRNI
jgi:hypothetical protein